MSLVVCKVRARGVADKDVSGKMRLVREEEVSRLPHVLVEKCQKVCQDWEAAQAVLFDSYQLPTSVGGGLACGEIRLTVDANQ